MKWFIALIIFMFLSMIFAVYMLITEPYPKDNFKELQIEKAALEIKVLQQEIKAYEEMDEELKSE